MKKLLLYEIQIITLILSFCSIVYELLLSSTLAVITGKPIWWQSMTIGVYIGGLGLGAFRAEKKLDQYRELFGTELILSFLGMICVALVYYAQAGYLMSDYLTYLGSNFHSSVYVQNVFYLKGIFFLIVQSVTFLIGMYSGQEIPLLIDIYQKGKKKDTSHIILGVNYIGTLVGTLFFAFYFFPKLDVLLTSLVVSILNLAVCLYLLARKYLVFRAYYAVFIFIVVGGITGIALKKHDIEQFYLKVTHLFRRTIHDYKLSYADFLQDLPRMKDIERTKSLYQYIDYFDVQIKGLTVESIMTLDTKFQYSTWNEALYHDAFAHIPLGMTEMIPEKVLVLGGGDGLLIRELLKYPEIKTIKQIELDEKIVTMHKTEKRFTDLNENSLNNPRVQTTLGDAFFFLRNNDEKFKAIFIDFPYPNNFNLAKLYSIEFYRYVERSLSDDGFVVIDAPVSPKDKFDPILDKGRAVMSFTFTDSDKAYNSVLLSTLHYAGFQKFFPYKVGGETFVLFRKRILPYDYDFLLKGNDKFRKVTLQQLQKIKDQEFPYRIDRKYINSIFRPRLIDSRRF
jgi:spermidine synthase